MWEKIKNVRPETWARTICLILALVNQTLAIFGRKEIPFVENDIYQIVSIAFTLVTGIITWWKNNSFTNEAIQADAYMDDLKYQKYLEKFEDDSSDSDDN